MADAEPTDDRLRLLIERVERLEEEKKGIADDIRDVYADFHIADYRMDLSLHDPADRQYYHHDEELWMTASICWPTLKTGLSAAVGS